MAKKKQKTFFFRYEMQINTILTICILCLVILSLTFSFNSHNITQNVSLTPTETFPPQIMTSSPTPTLSPIDMNLIHWKTYTLPTIGLAFQLPPQLGDRLGDLQEKIELHYKGNRYLVIPNEPITTVPVTHEFVYETPLGFIMGTDSSDFQEKPGVGRDGEFVDYQGFGVKNGTYYITEPFNSYIAIDPVNQPQEIITPSGVHILKIKGAPDINASGNYILRTTYPSVAAFINTNSSLYPGLPFQITLNNELTEQVFDKILSTFRFIR